MSGMFAEAEDFNQEIKQKEVQKAELKYSA
ncbi:hypothetical protein JIY74_25115 [Vibrio harveyi]|nr:hypothetical protein [Vibrio harveyi]